MNKLCEFLQEEELRKLIKEEIIKNLIDKIIFGFVAAVILLSLQKCAETYDRQQLQKQALLQIESQFIMDGLKQINKEFSLYLIEISNFLSYGIPLTDDQQVKLTHHKIKLQSEIEAISAYHTSLTQDGDKLIEAVSQLNESVAKLSDSESIKQCQSDLIVVKEKYQQFLSDLKNAAVDALLIHNNQL